MRSAIARAGIATLAFVSSALVSTGGSGEIFRWTQYGPDGLEARAVTDAPACPAVEVDGAAATMAVRAAPGEQFPVIACALSLPAATKSASIADVPVAVPAAEPRRIVVIGDTGCRLKGSYIQACNDPVAWPFRLIAEIAAQQKPDLVIHVGDYHYRETACPRGDTGCAGSPFGDTWPVWRADLFSPAETLLRVAPWVLVRGNHEECGRGGRGWSRLLAPDAFAADGGCNTPAKPVVIRLPGLTLAVIDVASAREEKVDDAQAEIFREQYRSLAGTTSGPTWILQHRPIWSPGGIFAGQLVGDNKTLAVAAQGVLPDNVTLMLSGHQHLFQVLKYRTGEPAQIVAGHGGDTLDADVPLDPAGWKFGPVVVDSGVHMPGVFGFAMLEKDDHGWQLTGYDRFGVAFKSCPIWGRSAACP
jgi:hypothetical protein